MIYRRGTTSTPGSTAFTCRLAWKTIAIACWCCSEATPEGKKELIGFQVGVRESAQSWRELLVDLKSRGLNIAPEVAVGDGALGFWKPIEEIFPGTRHQRCWLHKIVNVLETSHSRRNRK
jgi:transposase-like protein